VAIFEKVNGNPVSALSRQHERFEMLPNNKPSKGGQAGAYSSSRDLFPQPIFSISICYPQHAT
jgi:hypothetical protein